MESVQPNRPRVDRILETVRRYWGFDALRPLQEEAILAGLDRRDSLVVMPTGGGKSLCYHVPPAVAQRTDIVVSPLISLMKDQVDGLRACGYPAAALHGGIAPEERRDIEAGMTAGRYRLVFVAPERLLSAAFLSLLPRGKLSVQHRDHREQPEQARGSTQYRLLRPPARRFQLNAGSVDPIYLAATAVRNSDQLLTSCLGCRIESG